MPFIFCPFPNNQNMINSLNAQKANLLYKTQTLEGIIVENTPELLQEVTCIINNNPNVEKLQTIKNKLLHQLQLLEAM